MLTSATGRDLVGSSADDLLSLPLLPVRNHC